MDSEGLLSDLQAGEDSRLQTPSLAGTQVASPREPAAAPAPPATPEPAAAAAPAAEDEETLVAMPRLRPIRTRAGQRGHARAGDASGSASSSGVGSTAGGAASLNTSRSSDGHTF